MGCAVASASPSDGQVPVTDLSVAALRTAVQQPGGLWMGAGGPFAEQRAHLRLRSPSPHPRGEVSGERLTPTG